jgi:hypothetical protein
LDHRDRLPSLWIVTLAALAIGVGAAVSYYVQGLTLSHYDAKAHLVVARRVVDSMRPGWMQIGAVWLPLPHLLNLMASNVNARAAYRCITESPCHRRTVVRGG